MDELQPFPLYKKGVPKAGLDEITHWALALLIAGLPFFFIQMCLANLKFAPLIAGVASYIIFKTIAVPVTRYYFSQLPPMHIEHKVKTVFFNGGLTARPDPDPIPYKVK